jgi:hypothetical protein
MPAIAARSSGTNNVGGRRYLPSLQKRNKINLIKLPFMMQRYGSYRVHLSELGSAGEGNVMAVRPLIKRLQGMKPNWEYNVARDWSTLNYCKRLTKSLADNTLLADDGGHASALFEQFQNLYETNVFDKHSNDVRKMFHVYKSRDEVLGVLNSNKPLSLVYLDTHNYVACYGRAPTVGEFTGVCLNVGHELCYQSAKIYQWQISIDDNSMSVTFQAKHTLQFCVGLPTLHKTIDRTSYYIVTSNWEELVLVGNRPCFLSPANKTNLTNYS